MTMNLRDFRGGDDMGVEEMMEKIFWVKEHPEEAQEMAKRAHEHVMAKHRYYHRALTMFDKEFWEACVT